MKKLLVKFLKFLLKKLTRNRQESQRTSVVG